jgi:hypothetical protein
MNLLSGNFSMRLELSLVSLLSQAVAAVESGENHGPPPSPHFSIEGDESGVEGLPVKKTRTKVKLNGHFIQVVETQIRCKQGDVPINAAVIKMETL